MKKGKTMKSSLILKSIDPAFSVKDLAAWCPTWPEEVFIYVALEIGLSDKDGINLFYVTIATPEGLKMNKGNKNSLPKKLFIIDQYNYNELLGKLNQCIASCNRDTWEDSCTALCKYFEWEYGDYK